MVKIKAKRVQRRRTPPEEIERINERLFNFSRVKIQDRSSYDLAFNDLLDTKETGLSSAQRTLRDTSFKLFVKENPAVSKERIFEKAGGKGTRGLRQDRRRTADVVVKTTEEFKKKGASAADLKGFDTARQKFTKRISEEREFTIPSRSKRRTVFSRKETVKVKGKSMVRHRTAKGTFASVKKKKK